MSLQKLPDLLCSLGISYGVLHRKTFLLDLLGHLLFSCHTLKRLHPLLLSLAFWPLPLLYPLWSLSLLGVFPSFSSKGLPYTCHLAQSSPSFLSWSVCSLGWSTYSEVRSYQLTVASGTIRKRSMVGLWDAEEATVTSEEILYSEEGPAQAPGRKRPLE